MGRCCKSANAQTATPATVTRVVDGDTVEAVLTDGRQLTVRLIGIDTPETVRPGVEVECGGEQATEAMRGLVEGQQVSLVSDPTQDAVDRLGRSLFYVGRVDGLDVGEEMIRLGWAEVYVFEFDFERLAAYRAAQRAARDSDSGAWARCDGDFHRTRADELRQRRLSAVRSVRRYYSLISRRRFAAAWEMLGRPVRRDLGPFRQWKAGYRRSLGVSVVLRERACRGVEPWSASGCELATATRVAAGWSASPSVAAGSSRPARIPGWLSMFGCARPAEAVSTCPSPSARRHPPAVVEVVATPATPTTAAASIQTHRITTASTAAGTARGTRVRFGCLATTTTTLTPMVTASAATARAAVAVAAVVVAAAAARTARAMTPASSPDRTWTAQAALETARDMSTAPCTSRAATRTASTAMATALAARTSRS